MRSESLTIREEYYNEDKSIVGRFYVVGNTGVWSAEFKF
jgi:hypothetical protein